MKKSVIFLSILLVLSIAGTYAVYELYVKQRMKELAEHLERERQLTAKIQKLETTFFGTSPQVVLQEWREATQPWSDALERRTTFFALDKGVERVQIPAEAIPRFYYRDELPKRIQALQEYAEQKNVIVSDVNCGVPAFDSFKAGSNPTRAEIADHFLKYDYCASITRLLIDAGPESLQPLTIWPEMETKLKSGGTVRERTTGVRMKIRLEPLSRFLDSVGQSDRYFRINGLKISNTDLTIQDPVLDVELLLTQATFVPDVRRTTTQPDAGGSAAQNQARIAGLFGDQGLGLSRDRRADEDEGEGRTGPTWWQRFRKKYIPF